MKKLILASVMALGIFAATATSASADWDHDHRYYDRRHVVVEREYYHGPYYPHYYHRPYYTYVAPAPVVVDPYYAPPPPVYVAPQPAVAIGVRL